MNIFEGDPTAIRNIRLTLDSRSSKFGFDFRILEIGWRYVPRIYRVEIGLSAHEAGLRDGDFILSVNGESTENMTLEEVAEKIRSCPNEIELQVTSELNIE